MTSLAVIIPVKLEGAKSRLSAILTPGQREEFAVLMLKDVVAVLNLAGLRRSTYVVSPDREVLDLASNLGVNSISEPGGAGVNAAVARGISVVRGADSIFVVPSDLPLLKTSEIKHLTSLKATGFAMVISPSMAFDGTNALMFSGKSPFPLSYDDNSFWNHLAAAARERLTVAVCSAPGLMFDIDTVDDFRMLAGCKVDRQSAIFARFNLP